VAASYVSEFEIKAGSVTFRKGSRYRTQQSPSEEPRSELRSDERAKRDRPAIKDGNKGDRIAPAAKRVSGGAKSAGYNSRDRAAKTQPRGCALTDCPDQCRERDDGKEYDAEETALR
jgi:hypothetical protein